MVWTLYPLPWLAKALPFTFSVKKTKMPGEREEFQNLGRYTNGCFDVTEDTDWGETPTWFQTLAAPLRGSRNFGKE